jgi:hypothetical protein
VNKPTRYFLVFLPCLLLAACGGKRLGDGINLAVPDAGGRDSAGSTEAGAPGSGGTAGADNPVCARAACNAAISDLCCPPGCTGATDVDCGGCGNGRLEPGEVCDPLETCPSSCPQLKCEKQRLKSEGTCADVCVSAGPQTACQSGDECCPAGCTNVTDRDCTATCGNDTLEPGELCDPLASCPQSCPTRGCTLLSLKDAGTCLARCVEVGQQTACQPDDGCCPTGCTTANDNDCAVQCGNGVVEGQETCDPLASCPAACPAMGCRLRTLINGGTCAAACIDGALETACKGGDGCCPVGCNATNDSDCTVLCGNAVVEPGETCDPIASCMAAERACVSDGATTRTRGGDSGKCTFVCTESKRTCGPADGACPPGCGPTMDRDCAGCGNSVVEAGETCDPPSACAAKATACVTDNTTIRTPGGDATACTFTCSETARVCGAADGACPAGCTAERDADCLGCGNGRLDPGETCDPVADCQARAKACVSDAATVRTPQGDPLTCRFTCMEAPRTCGPADGVCPGDCGPTMDRDCPGCGNQRVERGETCDPCSAADVRRCVSDDDFIRMPTGAVNMCTFACTVTARTCDGKDGICPKMCTPASDPDCRPGPGEACTPNVGCRPAGGTCVDGHCCVQTCKDCQACTGAGGTCVNIARGQQDLVPAGTCATPNSCDGQGGCAPPPCQLQATTMPATSPPAHDFGAVALNGGGGTRVIFTNGCTAPAQPAVTVSPADYAISASDCTAPVPAGGRCIVSVEFRPRALGVRSGSLSAAVAGGGTTRVALTGTGVPAPAVLSFSPTGVDFGLPFINNAAAGQILLTNKGAPTGALTITSSTPEFTVVQPFCQSLATNAECIVHLSFLTSKTGTYAAKLTAKAAPAVGGSATADLKAQAIFPIGLVGQ